MMEEKVCLIKQTLEQIPAWVPFLGMVVQNGQQHTPSITRIVETLMAVGITSAVVLHGVTERLDERLTATKEQVVLQITAVKDDMKYLKDSQHAMQQEITDLKVELARSKK